MPIVERKPLAQALYKQVDINHPVPDTMYAAVAEVLAYVYQLKGKSIRAGRRRGSKVVGEMRQGFLAGAELLQNCGRGRYRPGGQAQFRPDAPEVKHLLPVEHGIVNRAVAAVGAEPGVPAQAAARAGFLPENEVRHAAGFEQQLDVEIQRRPDEQPRRIREKKERFRLAKRPPDAAGTR